MAGSDQQLTPLQMAVAVCATLAFASFLWFLNCGELQRKRDERRRVGLFSVSHLCGAVLIIAYFLLCALLAGLRETLGMVRNANVKYWTDVFEAFVLGSAFIGSYLVLRKP